MVVVWMSICLSQFNFRRQWYKAGHSVEELGFAAPLFPIVPILGFVFRFITCISMAADPGNAGRLYWLPAIYCGLLSQLLCFLSKAKLTQKGVVKYRSFF